MRAKNRESSRTSLLRKRYRVFIAMVAGAPLLLCVSIVRPLHAADALARDPLVYVGRMLFFDQRLSANGAVSCASCHQLEHAFTDGRPLARGFDGRSGTRNTPSLLNVRHQRTLFWDGRRGSLEEQVLDPFVNAREHALPDHAALLGIVSSDPEYAKLFAAIAPPGQPLSLAAIAAALAAYARSLGSAASPFDRYWRSRESDALSPRARRGFALFQDRAGCAKCHRVEGDPPLFTDHDFHEVGVGLDSVRAQLPVLARRAAAATPAEIDRLVTSDEAIAQLGRFIVTRNPRDLGKFKTPSLRNVAVTAPYMHDGSIETLPQAIDHELYYRGLTGQRPIVLTPEEKAELREFLESLTEDRFAPPRPAAMQ